MKEIDDNNKNLFRSIPIDLSKASKHTILKIENVDIYFPYKPYKIQVDYMASVIKALNNRDHALLQSPTGTGKTLCLLCACLGWL
jgi:regulator of telomere elongation helicase 1